MAPNESRAVILTFWSLSCLQLEPLRAENERLLRENNELHQQMIRVKEESKQMEQQWTLRLKSVEGRSQDLNFVNGQTSDQIRALEAENTSLR